MKPGPASGATSLGIWVVAMAAVAGVSALALPHVGPSLDFAADGRVAGHIADRSLTPIPVIQNAPGAWPLLLGYLTAFACACGAYVGVLRSPSLNTRLVWGAFTLGVVAALAIPFFPTSDPYAYALYALEAGPPRLDPFVSQSLSGVTFPWASALLAIFPDPGAYVRHCNYGPVAVFAYAALALPLAHLPLITYLFAERVFGAACVAVTGLALARSAPAGDGVWHLARYVLHPLVLTEFVAFGHGDALMLAFLATAFALWRRQAYGTAAACCVAALSTRSVAVLGLFALLLALARLRPKALPRALGGAFVATLLISGASMAAYGDISLGGAPAFNRFAAPLSFLATIFVGSHALTAVVFVQASIGASVAALIARRWWLRGGGRLAWLSFAALAGLPAVYPHYLGWVSGVAALRPGRRFDIVAQAATFGAPLWYIARMNLVAPPQPSTLAYGAALIFTWGSIAVALARTRSMDETRVDLAMSLTDIRE